MNTYQNITDLYKNWMPVVLSCNDNVSTQVDYLNNKLSKYIQVINTIIDGNVSVADREKYFQCDLGIFKVGDLIDAMQSNENINQSVTLYDENGIPQSYDYGDVIASIGATIEGDKIYLKALESLRDSGNDVSSALQLFTSKVGAVAQSMTSTASNVYDWITNTLSTNLDSATLAARSLLSKATTAVTGAVSWINNQMHSITGVTMASVMSDVFWPSVGAAASGITGVLVAALGGVFGIGVSLIGSVWYIVKSVIDTSSYEVPIITKDSKGSYSGIWDYDNGLTNITVTTGDPSNYGAIIGFINDVVEHMINSPSFVKGVWFRIPVGMTILNFKVNSYEASYKWNVDIKITDILCWNSIVYDNFYSSVRLNSTYITKLSDLYELGTSLGLSGEDNSDLDGSDRSYPTNMTIRSLIMSRVMSTLFCFIIRNEPSDILTDITSAGFDAPLNLFDWAPWVGVSYSAGSTSTADMRMTNLNLLNSLYDSVGLTDAIIDLNAGLDNAIWYKRYLYLLFNACSILVQGIEDYPDMYFPRWWVSSLPTPKFSIKHDASLIAQYSTRAVLGVSTIVTTAIFTSLSVATGILKKKAFNARRRADNVAFDETATNKQAWKANKLANLLEGLAYGSSTAAYSSMDIIKNVNNSSQSTTETINDRITDDLIPEITAVKDLIYKPE